ncbi:uncharacterized protein LOC106477675 [Limulus polyphemus]|uniref:Uncharacterized protein LOC106477675 n=1 Tax=Limulus polyphemus TaxID=6850 RepID=A0ABM1C3T6_LIMPO|nr:uncharacterized protein LOC106477675 [Limulus polyphemus]
MHLFQFTLVVTIVTSVYSAPIKFPPGEDVTDLDQKTAPSYARDVKAQIITPKTEQEEHITEVHSSPELVELDITEVQFSPDVLDPQTEKAVPSPELLELEVSKDVKVNGIAEKLLKGLIDEEGANSSPDEKSYNVRYSIDDGRLRRFRHEEKTPEGLIVGELGIHRGNGVIRGVQYTAEADVHPKLLYETLVKFLSL